MTPPSQWTADMVGQRLIEAFRLVPGRPVLSSQSGFSIAGDIVEAFGWPERFVADTWSRRILMTWARCRATGESVSEAYRTFGWQRSTAERRRRLALAAIAAGVNEADPILRPAP